MTGPTVVLEIDGDPIGYACPDCVAASPDELKRRLRDFVDVLDAAASCCDGWRHT